MFSDYLLNLVNNILDSNKIENGNLEINPQETNIPQFFNNFFSSFQDVIVSKGILPKLYLSSSLPQKLSIDPTRLTQILLNLLSNSLKFTETGEIALRVSWHKNIDDIKSPRFRLPRFENMQRFISAQSLCDIPNEGADIPSSRAKVMLNSQRGFGMVNFGEVESDSTEESVGSTGELVIEIVDTGPGMSEENVKGLFDKFT